MDSNKIITSFEKLFDEAKENHEFDKHAMHQMDETGDETVKALVVSYIEKNNELWKTAIKESLNSSPND